MKATLEFNFQEDKEDFEHAIIAVKMHFKVHKFEEFLIIFKGMVTILSLVYHKSVQQGGYTNF